MDRYCSKCGKLENNDSIQVCSNCGIDLISPVSGESNQNVNKKTISRSEVYDRAIPFFTAKKYFVTAQTDYLISFESQDRDVCWFILIVLLCLGIIPAAIYYFWFTHKHQITVSLSGTSEVRINVIGNTDMARKDAAEFMRTF